MKRIIINARPKYLLKNQYSFEQILYHGTDSEERYPPYTILYRYSKDDERQELLPGSMLAMKHGMIIDVFNSVPGIEFGEQE